MCITNELMPPEEICKELQMFVCKEGIFIGASEIVQAESLDGVGCPTRQLVVDDLSIFFLVDR